MAEQFPREDPKPKSNDEPGRLIDQDIALTLGDTRYLASVSRESTLKGEVGLPVVG